MDVGRADAVDRFGFDPRPPSPPPAWLRGPWWLRWLTVHLVVAGLFAAWAVAVIDEHDRTVVAGIAAPYFLVPMIVLVVLIVRLRHRRRDIETPLAFTWGAGLSLLSVVLFTFGYAAWPFMLATTPAAAAFLVYALTGPRRDRRGPAALAAVAVVLVGPVLGFAHLSGFEAAACWATLVGATAYLVGQRRAARGHGALGRGDVPTPPS